MIWCRYQFDGGDSVKRTSNHSEQRLFREEVLNFTQEKAKAFSLLFVPPAEGGGMEISMKKNIVKIGLAVVAGLVLLGTAGGAFVTGKMVCDGILQQNDGNDTKQNSIGQLEKWGFDREAFHETYKGIDFAIQSVDKNTIPGTYYRTTQDSDKWVILIHGAGGDRECVIPLVGEYIEKGYHVITYDQRGHGDNTDPKVSFGIFEKRDVEALVDYAKTKLGAQVVVVHGQSMGAQTAALYAATEHARNQIDAVILDSPVPGLELFMKLMFLEDGCSEMEAEAILTCGKVYSNIVAGMKFEDADTMEQAKKITVPCMVILSEKDDVCLPEYVEKVYDNVASSNKRMLRVDSKHIEGVIDHPQEYFDEVFQFLGSIR